MEATIPFYPLIIVPIAAAIWLFWRRAAKHLAVLRTGRPLDRSDRVAERIKALGVFVFGQRRLLNDIGPGLAHAFVFWGFLVLLATTGNYITNGLVETIVAWPFGGFLWSVIVFFANLFVGLVLAAIVYYVIRRTVVRPARLALTRDAFIILSLIFFIVLTEWVGDAFAYVVEPDDHSRPWAILAGPLSLALEPMGAEAAQAGYGIVGWAHIVLVLGFGAYLPYSKHLHILTSEPNVYFRNLEPRGALRKMDLEAEPPEGEELVFGAKGLKDLTWRHLLDPLACTECGRCMEFCPASMTGKTLSPKHLMEGLRDQILVAETALAAAASAQRAWKGGANGGAAASEDALRLAHDRATEALSLPLIDNAIPEEAVWQCTTCGWCVEGCPVLIEHVDTIVEIRRNAVLEESRFPKELNVAFRNMENAGNPWGQPRNARMDWAKGLDVPVLGETDASARTNGTSTNGTGNVDGGSDRATPWRTIHSTRPDGDPFAGRVLFWVGCAGAFDDRNRKVVRAMAQLLKQAGVDFAVLGSQESCTGDPARRAGNEYLFQMLADENVATLSAAHAEHGISTIVATCPHCFNTIRNEYPQFGLIGVQVIHHTQLLDRLVAEGRLVPTEHHEAVVAYHDACYLGRYNQVYDEGRRVVEASGGNVVEMDLHHRRGMCCGAGGARMWMEEHEGRRINHKRTEQALEKSPDQIATACPFCLIMLRDGTQDLERTDVAVRDVAELLADATGAWSTPGGAASATAEPEAPEPEAPAAEAPAAPA
ncbi:MAG TPA: heterodisulfide reductase-related iron-sulfur binding cluster [Candidatus Limnocylindria bacterium]|nr:heterodisulfide reductase-related iron-sulfur binding cluster [Candidatus Limnocylindria bacterium]